MGQWGASRGNFNSKCVNSIASGLILNCADLGLCPNSRVETMPITCANIAVGGDSMTCLTICQSASIVVGSTTSLYPKNLNGGLEVMSAKRIPPGWALP